MKYWTGQEIADGGKVPRKVWRIHDAVLDALDDYGWPGTKVVRVGRSDHDLDFNRFEVDLELAPGVVLPTYQGSHEGLVHGWEDKSQDVEEIVDAVVEGLTACQPLLPAISDTLHDLRRTARATIAEWQREGIHAEFLDVRLAPYDHWRGDSVPKTIALFEAPGNALRREVTDVPVEATADLRTELASYRANLKERDDARIALAAEGASGSIDKLALNAIALFEDVPAFLRRYATEDRIWLPDATAVHLLDGHVSAGTGISDGPIDWHGDSFTYIVEALVPKTKLDAAVGGPASALFDHPYLTPDILVGDVFCSTENGRSFVTVSMLAPRWLFCSVTGRIWEAGPASTEENEDGTVVPFRRSAQ